MRIHPQIGLTVGPSSETRWGQVLVTPGAYGVVEIRDESKEAQKKGAGILSHIGELLSHQLTSLSSVERAVEQAWSPEIVSLVVLVPVGRVVYVVLKGAGAVFVKRGKELAKLLSVPGGVSGEVRQADTLLLVSHQFIQALSTSEIQQAFEQGVAQEVAEKLTLQLHAHPQGEGAVGLVFEVERLDQAEEMVVDTVPEEEVAPEDSTMPISTPKRALKLPTTASLVASIRALRHDPKRATRVVAVIISIFFLGSVIAGIWKQTVSSKNKEVTLVLSDARHAFEEGVALLELNPAKGRERLTQAKILLDPWVGTVNARTKEGREVQSLYSQIQDNLTQSLQISEAPLVLFYDMELLKQGARATSFVLANNELIVGDSLGSAVYRIDVATKKANVLMGGSDVTGVLSVGIHGDVVYALTPEGIVSVKGTAKPTKIISKHENWKNVTSLISFGGNLYVLDTGASRIWKYVATEAGFSDIREYLNPDALPDFSRATSMSIDGTVWIGTKLGTITRFVQGKEETYIPKGVEPTLGEDLLVYATDETKNVYVADRANSRVVVLDKEGAYLAQYRFTSEAQISSIAVSEAQKKILLLSGGKIYSIDLK